MMRCWHPEKSRVNKSPCDEEQALARSGSRQESRQLSARHSHFKASSASGRVAGKGAAEGSAFSLNQTIKPSAASRVISHVKTQAINRVVWIYVPNKGLQKSLGPMA